MRIVIISTHPPIECGIATYTQFLTDELKKSGIEIAIISPNGAQGKDVFPAYSPDDQNPAKKIFDLAMKLTPDLIHIQHEYGLFGDTAGISVLELIHRFKASGLPVLATCHTVEKNHKPKHKYILEVMTRELDGIIVHQPSHLNYLTELYACDPKKTFLIPHGIRQVEPIKDAKKKLDLLGKKVILLFGYFRKTKQFEKVIDIFPQVVEQVPEAYLVIASKLRNLEYREYRDSIYDRIERLPENVKKNVEVFQGQFPQHTFDTILNAADISVFPYRLGAQSGTMAHAFAFGIPVVTSELPAFKEIIEESGGGVNATSDKEYVDGIVRLLTDNKHYEECSKNIKNYVKNNASWELVASKTLDVYKKTVSNLNNNHRYIYFG